MNQDGINNLNEDLFHLRNGLGDNINNANNKHVHNRQVGLVNEHGGQ